MTKGNIWLIVIFLMLFLSRLFCLCVLFTGVCRLGDETTEVKRTMEKRWAFGAENCVSFFDCWVVSALFFFVSIHLNAWNNNRWMRAGREGADWNETERDRNNAGSGINAGHYGRVRATMGKTSVVFT